MALALDYALVVLDLTTPKLGGPALCGELRAIRPETPLLAVTARVEAIEHLLGKAAGLDDYVLKPFSAAELTEKVATLLTRPRRAVLRTRISHTTYTAAGISFDPVGRSVAIDGKTIDGLSLAEFELLSFLADHEGRAFSEEELLAAVWNLHPPAKLKYLSLEPGMLQRRLQGLSVTVCTENGRSRLVRQGVRW